MTITIDMQRVAEVTARTYIDNPDALSFGVIRFRDESGSSVAIYTTPERAERMAALWAEMDAAETKAKVERDEDGTVWAVEAV